MHLLFVFIYWIIVRRARLKVNLQIESLQHFLSHAIYVRHELLRQINR